jgi:hypothetical protein
VQDPWQYSRAAGGQTLGVLLNLPMSAAPSGRGLDNDGTHGCALSAAQQVSTFSSCVTLTQGRHKDIPLCIHSSNACCERATCPRHAPNIAAGSTGCKPQVLLSCCMFHTLLKLCAQPCCLQTSGCMCTIAVP